MYLKCTLGLSAPKWRDTVADKVDFKRTLAAYRARAGEFRAPEKLRTILRQPVR